MRVVINPKVASIGTSQWPSSVMLKVEDNVRVTQCPKSKAEFYKALPETRAVPRFSMLK